jgi:hypothetical protein
MLEPSCRWVVEIYLNVIIGYLFISQPANGRNGQFLIKIDQLKIFFSINKIAWVLYKTKSFF